MNARLREIIDESRQELGTREAREVDWSTVDAKLFARIEQERRIEGTRAAGARRGSPGWAIGAAALAAAACFALLAGKTRDAPPLDAALTIRALPAAQAGNIVGILGSGEVLVDGWPAAVGAALHQGNVVEARGTSVTVERPGKLTLVLEAGTRATVTQAQGALVLALDTGAVEAQVLPVASGEAFAVDVGGARVAVHGTHLRVERGAERVVVDLNEGVVIVGAAPRQGAIVGALVTAPAHADFDAMNPGGTLAVTHEPGAVRAPMALASTASALPASASTSAFLSPSLSASLSPSLSPSLSLSSSFSSSSISRGLAPLAPPASRTVESGAQSVARPAVAASSLPQPQSSPPVPDHDAAAAIASGVRSCMAVRQSAENVTLVVNTTLHIDLDEAGNARAARFDPPVAPDVNACSAPFIYRTRWTHRGSADVPVDFKAPPVAAVPTR